MQTTEFDVIVIGGGLIGAAVGYGLVRHGQRVLILDEGDNTYRAARGNFGLIWVQGKGVNSPPYADWTCQSAQLWPELSKELEELTGIGLAFVQNGGFDFCMDNEEFDKRKTMLEKMAGGSSKGFSFEMLNNTALKAVLPEIGPTVLGASYSEWDGHVNPLLLLKALLRGFKNLGGVLHNQAVFDLSFVNNCYQVQSSSQLFTSEKLVLAAGFSNSELAPKVGLSAPLYPQRGQILVTEKTQHFLQHPTGFVRQTSDGGLLLGDSHEDVGFNEGTSIIEMQKIAKRAITLFPCLEGIKMVRAWGALRILTKDGLPIYEQSATCPGAYNLSSHSAVTLAAVHVFELAKCIANKMDIPSSLQCFSAKRLYV